MMGVPPFETPSSQVNLIVSSVVVNGSLVRFSGGFGTS